jgi:uncharacterized protein
LLKDQKKKRFNHLPFSGKPYNFFGDYLTRRFRCRVLKLPINVNLGCPNRDGTLGNEGCIFCSEEGSASPTALDSDKILDQMKNAAHSFSRTFENTKYIAYFQSFTNTYAPVDKLRSHYDTALCYPDTIGLMIGTRPDCLPDGILKMISSYAKKDFELWIELGMQSMHERSIKLLNRRHSHIDTIRSIERAASMNIDLCVHVILGIPGESWDDMMETAREISRLPVKGVKIHHLHVIRGTKLEYLYNQGNFSLITAEEYISTLCDFLERIRGDILIHRVIGDRGISSLVAPLWGMLKGSVQTGIEDEFARRGSWQGFLT